MLFIALILAITGYSCKERGSRYINQGEIHYNISYSGTIGVPVEFLPQNLIVSFKKDKILFEMTGIGNSGIINLANPEKGIYDTYYSFFNKKYYYAAKPGEYYPGFEEMRRIEIRKTSKKAVICNYNCKNAEVTFSDNKEKVYEIWYTNEIDVKNPNAATPFEQIDGVLMSFFFIMGPTELNFKAETVFRKDLPDETFDRKKKFVKVSKDQIDKFINNLVSL